MTQPGHGRAGLDWKRSRHLGFLLCSRRVQIPLGSPLPSYRDNACRGAPAESGVGNPLAAGALNPRCGLPPRRAAAE